MGTNSEREKNIINSKFKMESYLFHFQFIAEVYLGMIQSSLILLRY